GGVGGGGHDVSRGRVGRGRRMRNPTIISPPGGGAGRPAGGARRGGRAAPWIGRRPPGTSRVAVVEVCGDRSAGLAVRRLLAAGRAELRELEPVRGVATVLLGDVVARLAVDTSHG